MTTKPFLSKCWSIAGTSPGTPITGHRGGLVGTFYDSASRARRSAGIVRVEAAPCEFVARERAFGRCLVARAPAFAIPRSRVRFPPGPRQLRLKSQRLSTNVVRGACSCSPGWKIATFKYRRSTRSVLPQLRLKNRNF